MILVSHSSKILHKVHRNNSLFYLIVQTGSIPHPLCSVSPFWDMRYLWTNIILECTPSSNAGGYAWIMLILSHVTYDQTCEIFTKFKPGAEYRDRVMEGWQVGVAGGWGGCCHTGWTAAMEGSVLDWGQQEIFIYGIPKEVVRNFLKQTGKKNQTKILCLSF